MKINVGTYEDADTQMIWQGWIEPEDKTWILYVKGDGTPVLYSKRDPNTGAILENDKCDCCDKES